ncbi:hypothetical protein BC834DRAFT_870277 [Gloeopeniophorella convolvens]|nr:hypothetical protein BC834DRAFT_870277 [Gloeopeniophorella convolvens]
MDHRLQGMIDLGPSCCFFDANPLFRYFGTDSAMEPTSKRPPTCRFDDSVWQRVPTVEPCACARCSMATPKHG